MAADPGTAAALIAEIGDGSQQALRRLYDLESRRLYGVALRLLRRSDHAADAVQDAFIQVWQNAASFAPERGSASAWLTAITRYRALDIKRRHAREQPMDATAELTDGALEAGAESRVTEMALRRCLEALDTQQRLCVMLAFVEGLSHSEIASRTTTPLGTVKSWVRRGLLSLRSCLA